MTERLERADLAEHLFPYQVPPESWCNLSHLQVGATMRHDLNRDKFD